MKSHNIEGVTQLYSGRQGPIRRIATFVFEEVWDTEISALSSGRKAIFHCVRLASAVIRGLVENRCRLRAAALTYSTVFSLIPLLALAFAMRGVFHGPLERKLDELRTAFIHKLSPANQGAFDKLASDVSSQVNQFVDNLNNLSLGAIGAILLIFSVVSLLSHVEASLNEIWAVRRKRSLFSRIWMYWGLVTLGTIFIAASLSLTALPLSLEIVRKLLEISFIAQFIHFIAPYFITCLALFLIYRFMPNFQVKTVSAILGAVIAGVLWELSKDIYVFYIATMLGNADSYVRVYSGMAAIPLFLIWVYLSWIIFLLGAEISFAFQNLDTYHLDRKAKGMSQFYRETLALRVMLLVARNLVAGKANTSAELLAKETQSSLRLISEITHELCRAGLLVETIHPGSGFAPAMLLDKITPHTVMDRLRAVGRYPRPEQEAPDELMVQDLLSQGKQASAAAFESLHFRKLAEDLARQASGEGTVHPKSEHAAIPAEKTA